MKNENLLNPEKLRSRYLEQISTKEEEIRQLRQKLIVLKELEADASKPGASSDLEEKYNGWKLTKAVFDAVQTVGGNGGVPATEVRKYIAAHGYTHPNPKNFPVATVIALSRLAENEKISSTKTDAGKRLFMAKK